VPAELQFSINYNLQQITMSADKINADPKSAIPSPVFPATRPLLYDIVVTPFRHRFRSDVDLRDRHGFTQLASQ